MMTMRIPARRQSPRCRPRVESLEGRALLSGNLTRFPLPGTGGTLHDFIEGPDGTFWFVQDKDAGRGDQQRLLTTLFGKITPQGKMALIPLPANVQAVALQPLADGTLWFGLLDGPEHGFLSEVTPNNQLRMFPNLPTDASTLPISRYSLASPDDYWYVANPSPDNEDLVPASRVRIVRITPQGGIEAFPAPALLPGGKQGVATWANTGMVRAPDGAYWYEERINSATSSQEAFVRISPTGQTREFLIPNSQGQDAEEFYTFLNTFAFSRDGSLWFVGPVGGYTGGAATEGMYRMFPDGHFMLVAIAPGNSNFFFSSNVSDPTTDSLGNVWFTIGEELNPFSNGLVTVLRANPSGRLDRFEVVVSPNLITHAALSPGPDGSMYLVSDVQTIGRISRLGQVSYIKVNGIPNPAQVIPYDVGMSIFSTNLNLGPNATNWDDLDPLTNTSGSVLVAPNGDLWFVATTDGVITRFRPPATAHH